MLTCRRVLDPGYRSEPSFLPGHVQNIDRSLTFPGAVILSGFINAAKLSSAASGKPLTDHRILFFGAGSAGIGVAKQLMSFFKLLGMSEDEARERIYVSSFFFSPSHVLPRKLDRGL